MPKRKLPLLQTFQARDGFSFDIPERALQLWDRVGGVRAQAQEESATINVYGYIGDSFWREGVTASRIADDLKRIGAKDVIVNVNSPGGDFFEGMAIYNLLRQHEQNVTVRVIGLAASAASIISMGGDRVEIGAAAFLMIHNVMMVAMGNRHDMQAAADMLQPMDDALAGIYAARTGLPRDEIAAMLDKESWLNGDQAVEKDFADALLAADTVEQPEEDQKDKQARARAELQQVLAHAGYSRARQRNLLKEFSGTPSAAANATPSAGDQGHESTPSAAPVAQPEAPQSDPLTQGGPMDRATLAKDHPALLAALLAEGATAELNRIKGVQAVVLPGHEQLVAQLAFDGKTTPADAALQVNAAERAKLSATAANLRADAGTLAAANAPAPTPSAAPAATAPKADADDKTRPVAERCKEKWEADAAIRGEFLDLASYTAFVNAQEKGKVRILGAKR